MFEGKRLFKVLCATTWLSQYRVNIGYTHMYLNIGYTDTLHYMYVLCVCEYTYMYDFFPDNHRNLVSASQDGKLIVWDAYTTNKVRFPFVICFTSVHPRYDIMVQANSVNYLNYI